jgi:hypothetical protein
MHGGSAVMSLQTNGRRSGRPQCMLFCHVLATPGGPCLHADTGLDLHGDRALRSGQNTALKDACKGPKGVHLGPLSAEVLPV